MLYSSLALFQLSTEKMKSKCLNGFINVAKWLLLIKILLNKYHLEILSCFLQRTFCDIVNRVVCAGGRTYNAELLIPLHQTSNHKRLENAQFPMDTASPRELEETQEYERQHSFCRVTFRQTNVF